MDSGENGVLAGLFATGGQAMAVQEDLRSIGLADQQIDVGIPAAGRYQLDVGEQDDLGSAALDGIVVGTVVGGVIGVALLAIAVPQAMELGAGAILLGALMGGVWGSFFGGLGGMVMKASAHAGAARWCEIPEESSVLIVVARAGVHADTARKVMRRRGARAFLRDAPSLVPGSAASPSSVPVPAGTGHQSQWGLTVPAATLGAVSVRPQHRDDLRPAPQGPLMPSAPGHRPEISIPRGAFLLLLLFLIAVSALWANVYLRVIWRA